MKNRKVSFETFVKRTKLKDRMAAGFWYRMFELANLSLDEWISGKLGYNH